ncbi:hypothetical protein HNP40_000800 [Mycobacteroides chelonae]|nr:hypothetical protein [Mycobacteroides chelonae]
MDEGLRDAGFTARTAPVPTSLILLADKEIGVVTGNGPQTVDTQASDIRAAVGWTYTGTVQRSVEKIA